MLCWRHRSAALNPASPCFRIAMICSSLCRVPFIYGSPPWVTQNPKTGPVETRVILGRTVLERRGDDAEEGSYGRADRGGVAAGASGGKGGGYLPQGRNQ